MSDTTETEPTEEPVTMPKPKKVELELDVDPFEAQWPTGATVRYTGTEPSIELPFRTDEGVLLRRTIDQGATLEVSPELADSLDERDDFTRET